MLGVLDLVFPPEMSGKVVLSLCVILFALSSTYLLNSLRGDTDNPLILVPLLVLTKHLLLLGRAILSFRPVLVLPVFRLLVSSNLPLGTDQLVACRRCVNSDVLFSLYPVCDSDSRLIDLIFVESRTELIGPFAISFAPSIGLTIWYALERSSLKQLAPAWTFWSPHQLAGRWLAAFSPFPEFLPWLGIQAPWMKVFAILNLLVALASDHGCAALLTSSAKMLAKNIRSTCIRDSMRNRCNCGWLSVQGDGQSRREVSISCRVDRIVLAHRRSVSSPSLSVQSRPNRLSHRPVDVSDRVPSVQCRSCLG